MKRAAYSPFVLARVDLRAWLVENRRAWDGWPDFHSRESRDVDDRFRALLRGDCPFEVLVVAVVDELIDGIRTERRRSYRRRVAATANSLV